MTTEKTVLNAVNINTSGFILDPEVLADFMEEHKCKYSAEAFDTLSRQVKGFMDEHIKMFGFLSATTLQARPMAMGEDPSWEKRLRAQKRLRHLRTEEELLKKKAS